jgi:hypothetical protein
MYSEGPTERSLLPSDVSMADEQDTSDCIKRPPKRSLTRHLQCNEINRRSKFTTEIARVKT